MRTTFEKQLSSSGCSVQLCCTCIEVNFKHHFSKATTFWQMVRPLLTSLKIYLNPSLNKTSSIAKEVEFQSQPFDLKMSSTSSCLHCFRFLNQFCDGSSISAVLFSDFPFSPLFPLRGDAFYDEAVPIPQWRNLCVRRHFVIPACGRDDIIEVPPSNFGNLLQTLMGLALCAGKSCADLCSREFRNVNEAQCSSKVLRYVYQCLACKK